MVLHIVSFAAALGASAPVKSDPVPQKQIEPQQQQQQQLQPKQGPPAKQTLEREAALAVGFVRQRTLPAGLRPVQRAAVFGVIRDIRAGKTAPAKAKWGSLLAELQTSGVPVDVNAVIQFVLRESYLATNSELHTYADKVVFLNDQKQAVREHLSTLRKRQLGLRGKQTLKFSPLKLLPYKPSNKPFVMGEPVKMNRKELGEYLGKWDSELESLEDLGQLAMLDLQNAMQKQAQLMQMMSNIQKMMHDTAQAIIRNMK